jgi:glycine/D-amino acid oxidase-like deaminating enzyme
VTKYGASPWIDRFPSSRLPSFPRQRGAAANEVVIVGGGLTGCATAYAFAAAGIKVMLLESDRIGRGATAGASGLLADDPGIDPAVDLEKALGSRAARRARQSWRRASLDFQALLRRLAIKCELEPRPLVTVAADDVQIARLKREQRSRQDSGVDGVMLKAAAVGSELGTPAAAGLRSKDSATFDPFRAAIGLANAAASRGAMLFERTAVRRITFTRKHAFVATDTDGTIKTNRVVVATGMPTALIKSLVRHFWFRSTALVLTERVPAKVRQQLGRRAAVLRDLVSPPHIVRWVDDDRLLVNGADGDPIPDRQRDKILVQRTGQLMYELSTLYPDISGIRAEYGWAASYARTADGLPYIGAHRNYPHHLFAFGDSSHSVTGAYLASRIFLRQHLGKPDPADDIFGFHR